MTQKDYKNVNNRNFSFEVAFQSSLFSMLNKKKNLLLDTIFDISNYFL